ncbi:MAG: M23 family metallopeptidase, partial [Nitrospirae bacterium]
RFKKFIILLLVPFVLLVLSYLIYQIFVVPSPEIFGIEGFRLLPEEKEVSFTVKNAREVEVSISQGIKSVPLLRAEQDISEKTYSLKVKPRSLGLNEGKAVVILKARGGWFRKTDLSQDALIDTVPPKLSLIHSPSVLRQGMAGVVLLKATGADDVYVKNNDRVFKGYPLQENNNEYIVMVGASYDQPIKSPFYAISEDAAGNRSVKTLPTLVKIGKHKQSRINISDDFLRRVILPLTNTEPDGDLVKAFREVNEAWREKDAEKLREICSGSKGEKLWNGRFLQLKNSKVMAVYGDKREYLYSGKVISRSVHLGYDLASVSHADVEAANGGIIKYAGELGIYGNTVIIDHGFGLMSLYGHLSEIDVQEGQEVKKGEIIAKTGSTGLAGGDHLHFGVLVNGVEVSPIYWWDGRWIERNIERYL